MCFVYNRKDFSSSEKIFRVAVFSDHLLLGVVPVEDVLPFTSRLVLLQLVHFTDPLFFRKLLLMIHFTQELALAGHFDALEFLQLCEVVKAV